MNKQLIYATFALAIAMSVGSCSTDTPEQIQTISDQVMIVTNDPSAQSITTGAIAFKFYTESAVTDITMPVQVGGETKTACFKDVKLSYDVARGYTFSASTAQATDASGNSLGFAINSLNGSVQVGFPVDATHDNISISYTINGVQVFVTKPTISYFTTVTRTSASSSSFSCENATYNVTINTTKGKADIEINNIQFIQQMPTLSEITIPGIDVETTSTGFRLTAESIVPTSTGVPMENRTVSNLDITLRVAEGTMQGTFNCMGMDCTVTGSISYITE
ncbi:MAG: hypothetical protein ACI308_10215 [Muribaculaceae bacterium]